MSLASQEILKERYEIVRRIKSGGMGAVYEAIDRNLAHTACAIKEVLASALQGPDAQYVLQSFESEVRALATLDHPNIPRVRDYFEIDGRRYIVMDLVQGQPLDDELAEHLRVTQQPMDPAVAALDMVVVLDTLQYLHRLRPPIVHRDIKPANLIRDQRSGKMKLVDFGIARSVETKSVQTQVGTPGFCAPEQMAGQAEARSDLYSVGATLCYLCTGIQPRAYSLEPMAPDLPDHPGLVAIVKKATAFKAEDRYGDAEQMAHALRRWLRNEKSGHISADQIPATIRPTALCQPSRPPTTNCSTRLWGCCSV
ncbi:serine/threonine protein kinase [bacterium]|nr:serine/threonine protein kinase [bacterium]